MAASAASGSSPAVRRRSKRKVNCSGTAQSLGVRSRAQLAVRVPAPRNSSWAMSTPAAYRSRASTMMAAPYSSGLRPSHGIEPWQLLPVTSTSICIRPRCPR